MLASFSKFFQQKKLFQKGEPILLAVSGGIDSMVMVHLFKAAGLKFGVAHCNFQLREKDSDGDEAFVEKLAKDNSIPFYKIRFDTKAAAKHYDSSIQLIARELRYKWLEDIRSDNGYVYIATAHHLNDSLETVLYNLSKGCGIRGMHGIPVKNESLIRPLLFATKQQIIDYASTNNISYREDASNAYTQYKRNLIRHEVIPKLETINPSLIDTFARTLSQLQDAETLFQETINHYKEAVVEPYKKGIKINTTPLLSHPAKSTILYELLLPYGFNSTHIEQLLSDQSQIGAICESNSHRLLKDRENWIVNLKYINKEIFKLVKKNIEKVVLNDYVIHFHTSTSIPTSFQSQTTSTFLDYHKIVFPLTIRNWKAGDRFQPFGMGGQHKKIQDFLSDLKLNRFEKEEVLVLESDGKIAWVVGHRLDERFKIDDRTKKILKVSIE